MKIFGISGMPGSGKSFIAEIGLNKGATIVSMGDIIRNVAKKRGESTKSTAINLRKEFGQTIVAELTIKEIKNIISSNKSDFIIVEGIRSHHEVKLFKNSFEDFKIVSVFSDPKTRFLRLQERNREDDSADYDLFCQRDERELGFGIGNVIALSDYTLLNNKDIDYFKKEIEQFYENELN